MFTDNYYKKKNQMFNTPGITVGTQSIDFCYLFIFIFHTYKVCT